MGGGCLQFSIGGSRKIESRAILDCILSSKQAWRHDWGSEGMKKEQIGRHMLEKLGSGAVHSVMEPYQLCDNLDLCRIEGKS